MFLQQIPQSRAERLIANGRFILAIASFGAIYLDPLEPSKYPAFTYSLLAAYSIYALVIALRTAAAAMTSARWQVASHVIDLMFFGTINYATFGPTSPFFVFFVFSTICAMLRFGRRGTILTALLAIAVFVTSAAGRTDSAEFQLNRFIIRVTYLGVLASMLVYLTEYQERIQHDLQRIARWPRATRGQHDELVSRLMSEASSIFGARRALLAYQHLNERTAFYGEWNGEQFVADTEPDETALLLLERDSGAYVSSAHMPAVSLDLDDSVTRGKRPSRAVDGVPPQIAERYNIGTVVATPFKGDFVRGRLLLLDGRLPLLEEVNLARIAGSVIAGRLDHYHAAQQLQRGAVNEERVRVARDLHDSVLQSLTGASLQLHTLPRLMIANPAEAQRRCDEVAAVIASAQKELRWFIDELRPANVQAESSDRLASLSDRIRSQWPLEVHQEIASVVHVLPPALRHEIYALVHEAVANAARHANAKSASVLVDVDGGAVRIDVSDDGDGFPFHGRYDLRSLVAANQGPRTLKERVTSLGGSMIIDSSAAGARLEIRVPLGATA
ncbi:MAG TPA: sensor histidine kinase [Thermoanaerobaculia bacterium]|jgi:signal transduction histidine kinase